MQTYQLRIGDPLTLRLQDARTHKYVPIRFRFVGVAREFPTAPKDSFLVGNAAYVGQQTHSDAAEVVLMRVQPSAIPFPVTAVANRIAAAAGRNSTNILESQ